MLPAKHTAGLASCKYLIVLHCTAKCALRVCIVAVKYGIWLHWKRCIVCVWGRQKVFHNCLWQATGHRPWSFGRLDFHCFKCQAYGRYFFSNQTEGLRGWLEQLLQRKEVLSLSLETDQDQYTYIVTPLHWGTISNSSTISLLRLISSLQGLQYHTLSRNCTEEAHRVAILHGRPRLLLTMSSSVRSVKSLHNASLITAEAL